MKRFSLAAAALLVLTAAGSAHAASFTFNLNTTVNPSGGTATGAFATVTDTGANTVQLTLSLQNMPSGEFIDYWLFNFNGTQANLDSLNITYNSTLSTGHKESSIGKSLNGFGNNNSPGIGNNNSGLFDISINFPSANADRFNGGEIVVYDIDSSDAGFSLSASLFNITSAPNYNANGPYYSAAHIQGIDSNPNSGAMGANTSTPAVPEPSSVVLGMMGTTCLGVLGLRRRAAVAA